MLFCRKDVSLQKLLENNVYEKNTDSHDECRYAQ